MPRINPIRRPGGNYNGEDCRSLPALASAAGRG